MSKKYQSPEMTVVNVDCPDVITNSNADNVDDSTITGLGGDN